MGPGNPNSSRLIFRVPRLRSTLGSFRSYPAIDTNQLYRHVGEPHAKIPFCAAMIQGDDKRPQAAVLLPCGQKRRLGSTAATVNPLDDPAVSSDEELVSVARRISAAGRVGDHNAPCASRTDRQFVKPGVFHHGGLIPSHMEGEQ